MSKQSKNLHRFTTTTLVLCTLYLAMLASCDPIDPEPGVIEGKQPHPSKAKIIQDASFFGVEPNPADLLQFSNTHYGKMVLEKTPTIILFKKKGDGEEGVKALKILRKFEEKHRGQGVEFAWSEFEEPDPEQPHIPENYERLLAIVGINVDELPMLVVMSPNLDRIDLTGEVDSLKPDQLTKYFNDIKAGNYRQYMKSQEPVDNTGKDLATLVGTEYNEIIADKEKDVFVMIFSNKCGFCRKMVPEWKKLAKEYANNADVVIAKMDGQKNQVEGLSIGSYPQLIFYGKNYSGYPEYYTGDRELEKMKDWFEKMRREGHEDPSDEPDEEQSTRQQEDL